MKKLFYIFPLVALFVAACANGGNQLNGKFQNADNDGKMVYLLTMKSLKENFVPTDSTIIKDGKFSFKLNKTEQPHVAYLMVKEPAEGTPQGIPFVYEDGTIDVTIDSIAKIKGTPLNDKSQAFFDNLGMIAKKMDAEQQILVTATDDSVRQNSIKNMDVLGKEMGNVGFEFVKENIKNKVGEFYSISFMQMLTDDQIAELRSLANPEHQALIDEITQMKNPETQATKLVGQKYINVSGKTPEGTAISLSDYVGKNKLVLIDFWASWCGPCVKEMPNLVKAYAEYKSKGFEIVGISLDDDKDAWVKSLAKLNITWPQMSDLKGWESDLSKPYNVRSIPFTLLVDQDGNIVAENLRGAQLDQMIEKLLK